jgi:hypothetical protein
MTIKDVYYPLGCDGDMSEGAYQEMYSESEYEERDVLLNERRGYWRVRTGSALKIVEMSTSVPVVDGDDDE